MGTSFPKPQILSERRTLATFTFPAAATAFEQMGARIQWARSLLVLAELDSSSDNPDDAETLSATLKQVVDLTTELRLDADRALALNLSARQPT